MANKNFNVEVRAKQWEHPEKLIKRFLNKVKKERIVEEVKNREFYEPPSVKKVKARHRRKKVLQKLRAERESIDNTTERQKNKKSRSN